MADLALRHVSKRFGRQTVIDDISLTIRDREFAVLVGPSGCGKSTLLRLIAGLETPTTGEIWISGECVNDLAPRERGVAMVFQSYALYPHMTVYDNIAFGLTQMRMGRADINQRVRKAADRLQIADLLSRKPKELSGGQRQRVAIGRAIVREPRLFLFDEPLSNLDASLRTQMRLEFMKLHRELGTTIVYVTHDQAEAMTLASQIVVLRDGRIEQVGSPLDVYDRPRNRFVASFIGSPTMNTIACRLEAADARGACIVTADGSRLAIPVDARSIAPNSTITLGVRPEHVHASGPGPTLCATVTAVERLGNESLIHATLSSGEMLTWRVPGNSDVRPGAVIQLAIDGAHSHLFDAASNALPRIEETFPANDPPAMLEPAPNSQRTEESENKPS
jgi:multiple sugar transport system ATP-binding protein